MKGIYVHIPFCQTKCIYCDFYSLENVRASEEFYRALEREIELSAGDYGIEGEVFDTIFFGGGTPSLLPPEAIGRILDKIRSYAQLVDDAEITMECNPGTVTVDSLKGYRQCGVNRLSFGVQSFFADDLEFLSRIHTPDDAERAVECARMAGFDNINIDLISALPRQTMERWQANLARAVALQTEHISAYSLIFEKGTPLETLRKKGKVSPAPEEEEAAMYRETMEFLGAMGYEQYEVSNFALPGKRCRHNRIYWRGEQYWSIGPSAHGFMRGERYANIRSLKGYMEKLLAATSERPVVSKEQIEGVEAAIERAFLELRAEGIRMAEFEEDFAPGIFLTPRLQELVERFCEEGFLEIQDGYCRLTSSGYALCDSVTVEIVAAIEEVLEKQNVAP